MSADAESRQQVIGSPIRVLPRPPFQLRSLPIPIRWEVTRRHPYYQLWWEEARAHCLRQPVQHPMETHFRQAAFAILGAIGVSETPPDPTTDFAALDEDDLDSAWLSGAIHPITFRGLAGLMISALPKETLGHLGMYLVEASCDDLDDEPPKRIKTLLALASLDKPGLDGYPDEPIVSVNPAASGRQIEESVSQLLRQWKEERELSERRSRSDKHTDYLRVWDMREGWHNGQYDRTREQRLRDVAAELKVSISTVHNHYRSAFEMIVGYPYTPELWADLVGPIKLSTLFGGEIGRVSRSRPLVSPTRRDVPESIVGAATGGEAPGLIGQVAAEDDMAGVIGLIGEIQRLVQEGLENQQILDELELSATVLPAVDYLRERKADHL